MVVVVCTVLNVLGAALRCDAMRNCARWPSSYGLASDVACRKSPYRDAANSVMRASGGFWGLCDPKSRFEVMISMGCGRLIDACFWR
jgi:hypothetical protein